jgi:hypothetical protein
MAKDNDEPDYIKITKGPLKCAECSGWCQPSKVDVAGVDVKGWRCDKCGYEIIAPEDVTKAYNLLQAKKSAKVKISKRGNSYMITIPKAIVEALGLDKVKEAEVCLEDEHTISVKV